MDRQRLFEIIRTTTTQYRKSMPTVVKDSPGLSVVEHFDMPHEDEASSDLDLIDVHFMTVGVDKEKAKSLKPEFVAIIKTYPDQDRFQQGLSYIEIGAEIGDQGLALRLFALGHYLGIWKLVTPETLGITGEAADELAGAGFVMFENVNLGA